MLLELIEIQQVIRGHQLAQPAACPNEVFELMLWCWQAQSDYRPSFGDIMGVLQQLWQDHAARNRHQSQHTTIAKIGRLLDTQVRICLIYSHLQYAHAPPGTLRRVPASAVHSVPPQNPRQAAPNTSNYAKVTMPLRPPRREVGEDDDFYYNT